MIRVLDKQIADKIAAGEVIEFYASYIPAEVEEDTFASVLNILIKVFGAIAGIILYMPVAFVAVIVWGLAVGLDKSIGGAINTKRRISYKMKYRNIQNRKQAEAKDLYNLNLTYDVPEY